MSNLLHKHGEVRSKLTHINSYTVSEHWLPAIINGDTTGLSDEEEQLLECFLSSTALLCSTGGNHAVVWRCDNSTFYTRDDITGLFSMCVELEAWG